MSEDVIPPKRGRGRLPQCQNLTIREAAALIGLHPDTVRRLVKDRCLGHNRIGVKILIPRHVIADYLQRTFVPEKKPNT